MSFLVAFLRYLNRYKFTLFLACLDSFKGELYSNRLLSSLVATVEAPVVVRHHPVVDANDSHRLVLHVFEGEVGVANDGLNLADHLRRNTALLVEAELLEEVFLQDDAVGVLLIHLLTKKDGNALVDFEEAWLSDPYSLQLGQCALAQPSDGFFWREVLLEGVVGPGLLFGSSGRPLTFLAFLGGGAARHCARGL